MIDTTRKLIVNADDFGLTHAINKEIIRCIEDGILTSVSLIPNGYASGEAVSAAKSFRDKIGLGIHLTLDGAIPVLPIYTVPSMVAENAEFYPRSNMLLRLLTGRISTREVCLEWEAQIKKVVDSSLDIDHIDSHGHIHVFPSLAKIVVKLAHKYNIPAVRIPLDRFLSGRAYKRIPGRLVLRSAVCFSWKIFKEKLQHPDYMIGFSTGGCYEEKYFLKDIASIKQGEIVEAMFHPGPKNIDKEKLKAWGYKWDVDAKTLCSNKVKEYIAEQGVDLVTFRELKVAPS